jgi:hypothetical protein
MWPAVSFDVNDCWVRQNQGSGYFFRDPMNTTLLLNGNGHLPLS